MFGRKTRRWELPVGVSLMQNAFSSRSHSSFGHVYASWLSYYSCMGNGSEFFGRFKIL